MVQLQTSFTGIFLFVINLGTLLHNECSTYDVFEFKIITMLKITNVMLEKRLWTHWWEIYRINVHPGDLSPWVGLNYEIFRKIIILRQILYVVWKIAYHKLLGSRQMCIRREQIMQKWKRAKRTTKLIQGKSKVYFGIMFENVTC